MSSSRKFFVGGNWKMNGNKKEIDGIIGFLSAGPLDPNTGTQVLARLTNEVYLSCRELLKSKLTCL